MLCEMKRIPLICLVLSALFVNAALAVQGADTNNEKVSEKLAHPEPTTKEASPIVVDNSHEDVATTRPVSQKLTKELRATVKIDDQPSDFENPKPTSTSTAKPQPTKTPSPPTSPSTTQTPPSPITTSTSTPSPKPQATPTPSPSPPEYDWIVRGDNGTICILAAMTVKLEYNINNTLHVIKVPVNATGTGHCGNDSQVLQLSWPNNTMTFSFALDNKTQTYYLSNIDVVSKLGSLNKTEQIKFSSKLKSFEVNLKNSYECTWSEPITGPISNTSDVKEGKLAITISDVHIEAFHSSKSDKFSLALVCQTDASDIVPVMVGIALAVLVLVVLIVYVIGRRNSQARGYLSM